MSNKRINKAYVRYDGTGRVIAGALLLNRFKPTGGGKWHEIPAYECCNLTTTTSTTTARSTTTTTSSTTRLTTTTTTTTTAR
jgi:hypothetical protein